MGHYYRKVKSPAEVKFPEPKATIHHQRPIGPKRDTPKAKKQYRKPIGPEHPHKNVNPHQYEKPAEPTKAPTRTERVLGRLRGIHDSFGSTGLNIRPPDMGSFGMISPPADWMVHGPSAPSMQRKSRSQSRRRREPREPVEDYDPYESQHIMMGGIPKHMQRWM